MADRGHDRDEVREIGTRRHPGERGTDVGRTMGGGSLGHAPADDVAAEADLRNNPDDASRDAEGIRSNQPDRERGERNAGTATGREDDPVMPADDATLETKI